jgi:hypothetical protein
MLRAAIDKLRRLLTAKKQSEKYDVSHFCPKCGDIVDDPDLNSMTCQSCGKELKKLVRITLHLTVSASVAVKLTGKSLSPPKKFIDVKQGASKSKDGTLAEIMQVSDYRAKLYSKRVVAQDGCVLKNESGLLRDQSLHGAKRPFRRFLHDTRICRILKLVPAFRRWLST